MKMKQSFPFKIHWTRDMTNALRRMRRLGHSYQECAEHIGVNQDTVGKKARELKLNRRMNRGRRPGREIIAEKRKNQIISYWTR